VRPSVSLGGSARSEDDLTYGYQQVLKINNILKEQIDKGANMTIIQELKTSLQYYVSTVMDNKIAGQPQQKHKSGKPIKCVRSRLKGKEGRLRGNLMGKRVDFSARTVITPDPNLRLDELGVPFSIAQGLTIPEVVTAQNIHRLRALVENGPSQWPGAKYIIRLDNKQIDLSMIKYRSDLHLELGYVVERHLQDGDYVMFNRQPSLHKMSIMGHRVKVLPFSTFRMNLSVTTPYNADFDGDEMNMHVPQSLEAMAEIKEIMAVPKQILAPQANKPCMGIVQDSLLGTMLMTERDTFIEKDFFMQLLMWMPDNLMKTQGLPTPAVLKPKPLWTGKQVFSMLIPRVNLSRIKSSLCCPRDSTTIIDQGELLCGVLNKSIVGSTSQGLNHVITKDLGAFKCADFMSGVQKIVNNWLIVNGFTVGVQDIIVHEKNVAEGIQQILSKYKRSVSKIIGCSQVGKLKS
jgi:DNA-directed RNA polymerase II subunit RPB1